jgi:hypothetical protein
MYLCRSHPMKLRTLVLLLALCGAHSAFAEMHRCLLPDGRTSFQQFACDAPPPAARTPVPMPVVSAPGRGPSDEPVRLTRRNREVLELTAQFERCRVDADGFADKSDAVYAAWMRRYGQVLAEHNRVLQARIRAARRGETTVPLAMCTDDWLRDIEPLSRMPDARFATVEKTWQVFMGALMTGDRLTALSCLEGRAGLRWRERVEAMSNEELRIVGASIRTLKVQWGDDYEKEAVVADVENRVVGIAFRNTNEEWKITDWGGAAAPAATP